jgi:hypothetical protein
MGAGGFFIQGTEVRSERVAVWTKHFKVFRAIILRVPVDMVYFEGNFTGYRVNFTPSAFRALMVALL